MQKPYVVLVELTDIRNAVAPHAQPLDAQSEGGRGTTFLITLPDHGQVEQELLNGAGTEDKGEENDH